MLIDVNKWRSITLLFIEIVAKTCVQSMELKTKRELKVEVGNIATHLRYAQNAKTFIAPDNKSPWPPHLRGLPGSSTNATKQNNIEYSIRCVLRTN